MKSLEIIRKFLEHGILEVLLQSFFNVLCNTNFDLETFINILEMLEQENCQDEKKMILERISEFCGKEEIMQKLHARFSHGFVGSLVELMPKLEYFYR